MGMLATILVPGGGRLPRPVRFVLSALRHPRTFAQLALGAALVGAHHHPAGDAEPRQQPADPPPRGPGPHLRSAQGHGEPNPTYIPVGHRAARLAAEAIGGVAGGSINESLLNIPITAHILGGACIGDGRRHRGDRRLPPRLRPPRAARLRRLGGERQPRRQPVAHHHRDDRAGDVVVAQPRRRRPAARARRRLRAASPPVRPRRPRCPRARRRSCAFPPATGSSALWRDDRPRRRPADAGAPPPRAAAPRAARRLARGCGARPGGARHRRVLGDRPGRIPAHRRRRRHRPPRRPRARRLEEVRAEIAGAGGDAHVHRCDLSDLADVERMAVEVLARHGHVDVLVNNAGRSIRRPIDEFYERMHDFERTMQLNYFGAVRLILALLAGDARAPARPHRQRLHDGGAAQRPALLRLRRLQGGARRLLPLHRPRGAGRRGAHHHHLHAAGAHPDDRAGRSLPRASPRSAPSRPQSSSPTPSPTAPGGSPPRSATSSSWRTRPPRRSSTASSGASTGPVLIRG